MNSVGYKNHIVKVIYAEKPILGTWTRKNLNENHKDFNVVCYRLLFSKN